MASTRDQVEAYNFAARRQVLALLQGDETVTVDPRRRLNRSLIGGLLLAVVVLAATGVAGFLTGGSSTSVPTDGVIVDSDGGAYVLIGHVLHPALNMTSARLIAGDKTTTVSSSTLRSLPRGLPVGIPGAPDSLPPQDQLTRQGWSVCTIAAPAKAARPQVVVSVGVDAPRPLRPAAGLVVATPDGTTWLLEGGLRYEVTSAASTLLGLDQVLPVNVPAEVVDLLPEGPPLAVPTVPDSGRPPTAALSFGAVVGDLVKVDYGNKQPGRYVVLSDGVAPVNAFAFSLLAGGARKTWTEPARDIVSVAATSRPAIPALWPRQALNRPAAPPAANEPLCISYDPRAAPTAAAWRVTVSEPARLPLAPDANPVAPASGSLATVATGIAVPGGRGALVKAVATGGVDAVYTLVTDSGLRFTIANAEAVQRLGYNAKSAISVPLPFLDLLPAGPGLDPAAAATEYAGSAVAPSATATAPISAQPTG